MPIEELIKQSDLFGDVDPVVAQMALFIKENNRSSARMGAAFVAMAEFVVKELESRQNASLFEDDAPIDMVDVLKAANAQLQKQYGEDVKAIGGTGGFIDLFTETRGQKADREAFLAREAANEDKQADPIVSTNHDKIVAEFDKKQREYSIIIENIINEKIKALGDGNYNLGFDKFMASVNESSSLMMVNEANAKNALSMYEGASKAADFLYNKYSEKVDKDLIFSLQSKFGTKVRDENNIGRKWYAELQDMAYQAKKTLPFDPVAIANINAASISETLKKKAIKWLQENPESHELKGLSAKSLNIIIENIRSALFAEVMALSPLFKAVGDSNLSLKTPSGYLSMAVFKQKGYVTGYKIDFIGGNDNYANNLLDSTSTIEELKQWGFSLPFDLDVKAFVANVIKPEVDKLLSQKEIKNELETENESIPIPIDSDVVIAPESEDSNEVDNQTEEQVNEAEAVEDLVPDKAITVWERKDTDPTKNLEIFTKGGKFWANWSGTMKAFDTMEDAKYQIEQWAYNLDIVDVFDEIKPKVKFSAHDIVYLQDINDENKRIPVNFRGYMDGGKAMIAMNGSQFAVETDRLFKDDLPAVEPEIGPITPIEPVATQDEELTMAQMTAQAALWKGATMQVDELFREAQRKAA